MKYKFTTKLPNRVCRICGKEFDKKWSSGGVGAVCPQCITIRDKLDLVKEGVVRNIVSVPSKNKEGGISFTFEALIDSKWYKCSQPCGDWAVVDGWPKKHNIFSVPVGWWELRDLKLKHYIK